MSDVNRAPIRRFKLVALSISLSNAATTESGRELYTETAFVRAIEQLDSLHLQVLKVFTQSPNEAGWGDGTAMTDRPVVSMNNLTLERPLPDYKDLLPGLTAALQSNGLIVYQVRPSGSGMSFTGTEGGLWVITDLGRRFLERMKAVEAILVRAPLATIDIST